MLGKQESGVYEYNIEKINCPACHKEMHKIFISSANINIDICLDGCGGIYFDNREFDSFNETHEDIQEILDVIKNNLFFIQDKNDQPIKIMSQYHQYLLQQQYHYHQCLRHQLQQ